MRKINLKDVPEEERKSPKGKFGRITKNISIALGREPESLDVSKRHPFDLALVRIPKGESLCPYHAHAAESELYLVVSGRGSVRDKNGTTEVGPGDAFLFQPGEAHQLSNAGNEDFVYYVIADNPGGGGKMQFPLPRALGSMGVVFGHFRKSHCSPQGWQDRSGGRRRAHFRPGRAASTDQLW